MISPPPSRSSGNILLHPYLLLTLATVFAGGNVVAGKLAVGQIEPGTLLVLRWAGAILAVLPFAIGPLRKDWPVVLRHWALYLFYGAVGFAAFTVLVYIASYMTSGVNISIEQVAINIFVMLINFAVFRIRVRRLQLIGVALTIVGVALTATRGDLARLLTLDLNLGDGLILIACAAHAVYVATLRFRPATNLLSFLAAAFVGAFAASVVYLLVAGGGIAGFMGEIPRITPQGWLIVVFVAIFPSGVTQLLYARGIDEIGANRASLFANLTPLFGALGSILIVGERPQLFHAVAIALIVAGIVLAEWSARRT